VACVAKQRQQGVGAGWQLIDISADTTPSQVASSAQQHCIHQATNHCRMSCCERCGTPMRLVKAVGLAVGGCSTGQCVFGAQR
jgi:hypothetical protein